MTLLMTLLLVSLTFLHTDLTLKALHRPTYLYIDFIHLQSSPRLTSTLTSDSRTSLHYTGGGKPFSVTVLLCENMAA